MYSITRRIQFCCGHRVVGHEGKCQNLHGHNYVLYVYARPKKDLDDVGRVIDFSVIKEKVGGWIDDNWDHGFVYFLEDEDPSVISIMKSSHKSFPLFENPTAENRAAYLLNIICPVLFLKEDVEVWKIKLYETENCFAEVSLDDFDKDVGYKKID